jgi:mannose-1-phosphate guanylyltransferase
MLYAVIMAGGSGTRFWPESRRKRPKQLLRISGDKSMIRLTVERILPAIPYERVMVVTGVAHAQEIRRELPELLEEMLVEEPLGRNTAPCIALAAHKLIKNDPDAIMAVLPADHLIGREDEFLGALSAGAELAASGDFLITYGIVPNRPETGFGYIRLGRVCADMGTAKAYEAAGFVEKPDHATALDYVASGQYLWNGGMFVWQARAVLKAIENHAPDLSRAVAAIAEHLNTSEESAAVRRVYQGLQSESIDKAVMEKAGNVLCLPLDADWNDVGSWAALSDVWPPDKEGNCSQGEVVFLDSRECVVSSPHKVTALIGAEDLIVVDTPDALMICRRDQAQDVRRLRELLKERGYDHLL